MIAITPQANQSVATLKQALKHWRKALASLLFVTFGGLFAYMAVTAQTSDNIYNPQTIYATPKTRIVYAQAIDGGGYKVGVFENSWYLVAGTTPNFDSNDNGWKRLGPAVIVTNLTDSKGTLVATPAWSKEGTYVGGDVVRWSNLCFKAKWWTKGDDPSLSGSPWETTACPASAQVDNPYKNGAQVPRVPSNATASETLTPAVAQEIKNEVVNGKAPPTSDNPVWNNGSVYLAGSVVAHTATTKCYKAKWWNLGFEPTTHASRKNIWDSPWEELQGCPTGLSGAGIPANLVTSDESSSKDAAAQAAAGNLTPASSTAAAKETTASAGTVAAIPPVVAKDTNNTSKPVTSTAPTVLPSTGYEFLRLLTDADWDWLFPMRSGYLAAGFEGGSRNQGARTDPFSREAFIRAVLEYNNWAKTNGYKLFLNEGTLKQQAEEFLVFWAKSARETSGTWSTAPAKPGGWIQTETIGSETLQVWKGALYWVEEVGYTTDPATGKSSAINYVDGGSTGFPPVEGRSYYGRGVIQLSWNYNYGAFSSWMYDNGLFKSARDEAGRCKIDKRDKLLEFPNLVADCGDLSILSGIWFWMTPQGAKPSSHDVMHGHVTNISSRGVEQGLPPSNNGYTPKTASGSTTDEEVFAYRLGTVINIVNGGLECNKAAAFHGGPPQRVSYYNAYAAYFNDKYKVNAMRLTDATGVWNAKVSSSSQLILQSATCYNQKSYYGW